MLLNQTTQSILSGVSDFFGLDMGVGAVRVVQLKGPGPIKALDRYGQAPFQGTMALSESQNDRQRVAQTIRELVRSVGIDTKNVAVNLPSDHVFTTVIEIDKLPPQELAQTIRYQADSYIPTPLAQSKIDWAVIGDSARDPRKVELLLSSVENSFVEKRLNMLESIGLNVIAFEPDSMALARAVVPADSTTPQMILDIGEAATDLVMVIAGVPHLSRSIPTGTAAIVRTAAQNLSIDPQQAQQFVYKFGLGKDKLEGQVYNAIIGLVETLMAEVEKSIKYFQDRYPSSRLERIIVTGGASALPEFPLYIANRFGVNVEIGDSWSNISFPPDRRDELLAVSNHFAVAAGLAERQA